MIAPGTLPNPRGPYIDPGEANGTVGIGFIAPGKRLPGGQIAGGAGQGTAVRLPGNNNPASGGGGIQPVMQGPTRILTNGGGGGTGRFQVGPRPPVSGGGSTGGGTAGGGGSAGGASGNAITQPGLGTYQTGISAGRLPQSDIDSALGRLNPSNALTANSPFGLTVEKQQQGELNSMLGDALRAGTWEQRGNLARDAAYQQSQMQLAFDRARSNAALGGFTNMYNQEADRVNNSMSQQSMLMNLLSSLLGGF